MGKEHWRLGRVMVAGGTLEMRERGRGLFTSFVYFISNLVANSFPIPVKVQKHGDVILNAMITWLLGLDLRRFLKMFCRSALTRSASLQTHKLPANVLWVLAEDTRHLSHG
jgi:hypothetical protein